ncbi:MAG: hypothetical protein BGO14_11875 [Chlamydiales bacterium 38-26]|nr:MFS transporter [Chlamydiales bacterium]OJV11635.1 MAG: hypothetical protein BGO14_11875 [Chlamydiales bacterium 38-26]
MTIGKNSWTSFLTLWICHTLFLVLSKVVVFILLIYLEQSKGLTGISIFGAASILPAMLALPFLSYIIDKIHLKAFMSFVIAIQIPLIYLIFTHLDSSLDLFYLIIVLIAFSTVFALLENILFDKLIKLIVTKSKLMAAVSISRLSNAMAYFLSPLIAGFAYHQTALPWVNGTVILLLIVYLIALTCLERKDPTTALSQKTHIDYFFKNKRRKQLTRELLFLYSISFIWMNAVIIVCLPYFNAFHSTQISSLLISLSGAGGLVNNLGSLFFPLKKQTLFYCRLSAFLTGLMLFLLGILPAQFILQAVIMFTGGFFATWCYILSQLIAQRVFESHYLGAFFGLRSWVSTGMTAVFYLFTGYFVGKVLTPSVQFISKILGQPSANIEQYQAIQYLFIGVGSLVIFILAAHGSKSFLQFVKHRRI